MGFNVDLALFADDCFKDPTNLPMAIDLQNISDQEIINLTTISNYRIDNKAKFKIENDYGFFELGMPIDRTHKIIQLKIAKECNRLYQSDLMVTDPSFKHKKPKKFKKIINNIPLVEAYLAELKNQFQQYRVTGIISSSSSSAAPSLSVVSSTSSGKKTKKTNKKISKTPFAKLNTSVTSKKKSIINSMKIRKKKTI